jgi:thioredoxin reductase (NADPH)
MSPATPSPVIETDAVVIGAGPVGLYQVFQLGLLEIRAHAIDSLPYPGGQPAELYPDKPIYDIPAVPVCTGRELAQALLEQIRPFDVPLHLGQTVTQVQPQADGRFWVQTSKGTQLLCRTLFIAAGVGAFEPRRLRIEGLDRFEGSQLFHHLDDAARFAGKHVVVVGGDDTALHCALRLAHQGPQRAASVTLVHRRDGFQASPALVAQFRQRCQAQEIAFRVGQITGFEEGDGRLRRVAVTGADALTHSLALDALGVFLGLSPKLGPVTHWGLAMERKQLVVNTETFCTSVAGIFAVGDINTYPGKKKLIVCGFHEAVLAAYGAAAIVFPDQGSAPLQYTTTSTRLHKLLGVSPQGVKSSPD